MSFEINSFPSSVFAQSLYAHLIEHNPQSSIPQIVLLGSVLYLYVSKKDFTDLYDVYYKNLWPAYLLLGSYSSRFTSAEAASQFREQGH